MAMPKIEHFANKETEAGERQQHHDDGAKEAEVDVVKEEQLQMSVEVLIADSIADCDRSEGKRLPEKFRKHRDSGLRSKRGEKALNILVSVPVDESNRSRLIYNGSLPESSTLYPLDLPDDEHDSVPDDESEKNSPFPAEVAANGFGSPIELLSRDNWDTMGEDEARRHLVEDYRTSAMSDGVFFSDERRNFSGHLEEIHLTGRYQSVERSPQWTEGRHNEDAMKDSFAANPSSNKSLKVTITKTIIYILLWYIFSTSLTLYNKILLGVHLGNFPAPLLMNTIHFSMQAVISTALMRFCYPSLVSSSPMSWKDYFLRVVPTAVATALDIDLTNVSLVFISVTFATMCKSGAPVFLLLFAFAFKLEVPSFKLLGIILIISIGVLLTVTRETNETNFDIFGFILIISAAVMSGFRWTVTQILLQKEEYGLSNPFAAMSYLTPVMAAVSVVFSLLLEPWHKLSSTHYFDTPHHVFGSLALMLLGGALAFFMVYAEYLLISATSAVTLTVAGVVKEVLTIVVAVIYFHDHFTVLKGVGLVIIILGVSLFNWFKYEKVIKDRGGAHLGSSSLLKYSQLTGNKPIFELGDDLDEEIL